MKTAWYSNKWAVIFLHTSAWVLLFSLPYLLRPPYEADKLAHVDIDREKLDWLHTLTNFLLVPSFYLNALILIPTLVYKKRYWEYAGLHLLIFSGLLLGNWLFVHFLATHTVFHWQPTVFFTLFPYLFILASSTAYQMIRDKTKTERLAKEKENENLKTELSFLRSQVSPHFMFNVLNNMVSLARKQSDQLEPSLIKLSSLMRYMLYETDEEKVPLEKEIDYLQSYIDLQEQRFGKKVKVSVSLEEVDDRYDIEPMLLIPFVENAFKHGTGMIEDGQIQVQLRARNHILQFSVRNKYNISSEEIKDKTSGIGLANVKRRLNLLYGGNHSLLITRQDDWFVISLQINLH
jgi:sensor histidine kinase YesM